VEEEEGVEQEDEDSVAAAAAAEMTRAAFDAAVLQAAIQDAAVEEIVVGDDEIMGIDEASPRQRCFKEPDRNALVEKIGPGPVHCMWCGYEILELAEAEMDHVAHYAMGGPTVISNCCFMHRACNLAKDRLPFQASPLHDMLRTGQLVLPPQLPLPPPLPLPLLRGE
jgi:hypothetical protein